MNENSKPNSLIPNNLNNPANSIIIGVDFAVSTDITVETKLCPECKGTGGLKAMQMAYVTPSRSERTFDIKQACSKCKGVGFITKYY